MKLKQRNSKKTVLMVCLIVLAVLVVGALVFMLVNSIVQEQQGKEIINISIDTQPRLTYTVGEDFNPAGARLQVITRDSKNAYFVYLPNKDVTFSGYDKSTVGTQVITVTYKGVTTTLNVIVNDPVPPAPSIVSIEVPNLITTYEFEEYKVYGPILNNLMLVIHYSDDTIKEIPMDSSVHLLSRGQAEGPGTTTEIVFIYEGVTVTYTITIE